MAHTKFPLSAFFIWMSLSAVSSQNLGNCFDGNKTTQCDMNRVEIFGEYHKCIVLRRFRTLPQLITKDNKLYLKTEKNTYEYDLKTDKLRQTVDIQTEPTKIFKHKNLIFSSLTGKAIIKTDEKKEEHIDIFTSNECLYDQIELHPESNTLFILSHDKNGQEMEEDGVLYFLNTTNIENLKEIPVSEKIDTKNQKFTTFLVYGNNLILSGTDQIGGKLMIIPLTKSNPCEPNGEATTRSPISLMKLSPEPLIDCENMKCLAPLCRQNELDELIKNETERYDNLVIMINTLKNKLKNEPDKSDITREKCSNEKSLIRTLTTDLYKCNNLIFKQANTYLKSPPTIQPQMMHPQIMCPQIIQQRPAQVLPPFSAAPQFPNVVPQQQIIGNLDSNIGKQFFPNPIVYFNPIVNQDQNFPYSRMIACRNSLIKLRDWGVVDDKNYRSIWKACGADVFTDDDNDALEKKIQ